ncbi:MAG TPA: SET domain-containing protein-lysine N-methyltransferase [Candidatus Hydrogenedentes bacterium]|nr:SET domain-containing protein-lysine N-methyltransferase [Candidatus Hydrogenedentota bacterium]
MKSYTSPKTKLGQSKIGGIGTFAASDIKKGEIVFVKGGHIVERHNLFFSEKINSYLPISDNLYLGALAPDEEDEIKLFVNHSCDPNCGLRGEITFVAMRDINKGEELTFDYAMVDNEENEFVCNCGSEHCRKIITGYDWKIKELQEKYTIFFARYLLDKINSSE